MNFRVKRVEMLDVLQRVGVSVGSRTKTVPILESYRFEISGGMLTVRGGNIESVAESWMGLLDGRCDEGVYYVCLPKETMLSAIKGMRSEAVEFEVAEDGSCACLMSGCDEGGGHRVGRYKLAGKDATIYPSGAKIAEGEGCVVEMALGSLFKVIDRTLYAVKRDGGGARVQMSGVNFELDADKGCFKCCGTDAHMMSIIEEPVVVKSVGVDAKSCIMSGNGLSLLHRMFGSYELEEVVTVTFTSVNTVFQCGDSVLTLRNIDGRYPNFEAAIPRANNIVATVDKTELLDILGRVMLFANKDVPKVVFEFDGAGLLKITGEDVENGTEATEEMAYEVTEGAEPITIGFNAKYMSAVVGHVHAGHIRMEMSAPSRACVMHPLYVDGSVGYQHLSLIMPVIIN